MMAWLQSFLGAMTRNVAGADVKEVRKGVARSVCWILVMGAPAYAQEDAGIAGAGSPERRGICNATVELFVLGYPSLAEGTSFERVQKELEIALAGHELEATLLRIALIGAALSEQYANDGRTVDDLKIDFLHPCITTTDTIEAVAQELFRNEVPKGHPMRDRLNKALDGPVPGVQMDGDLSSASYREILGDEFEATHSVEAIVVRGDGAPRSCGYEFATVEYDYQYSQGKPVKVSGSINIASHPNAYLIGTVKIKGEDIEITVMPDGTPNLQLTAFEIANVYPTFNGEPLIEDYQRFECEDASYICSVNFQWDKVLEALIVNELGVTYRRNGGGSDVPVSIDLTQPDGSRAEIEKANLCLAELSRSALSRAEADDEQAQ